MSDQSGTSARAQGKSLESFWGDLGSVLVNVADVAVKILPLVLGKEAVGEPAFLDIGPLRFSSVISGGSVLPWVHNLSDEDYAVVLNASLADEYPHSELVVVPPSGHHYFEEEQFKNYSLGGMTIAKTHALATATPSLRQLTGAATAVGFAVAAQIFPGFTVTVGPNPEGPGYRFQLDKQTTTPIEKLSARITDFKGNSATVDINDKGRLGVGMDQILADLPETIEPNPGYNIYMVIDMVQGAFDEVVQASKSRRA